MGRKRKYFTEAEARTAQVNQQREWVARHREEMLSYQRNYYRTRGSRWAKIHGQAREAHENVREYRNINALTDAILKLYQSQGNLCAYCFKEKTLQIDHKLPVSRGGTNDSENLQLVCGSCNRAKNRMTHEEFVEFSYAIALKYRKA